jgi:hypothetical protein
MSGISSGTLMMAIQGVHAEIVRILAGVQGNLEDLGPDDQELLMAFDKAESELKALYLVAVQEQPGLPAYEQLVQG